MLSFASPVRVGYALIDARGTTVDFGAAQLRSPSSRGGAVAAVSTADGQGLRTVTSRGVVSALGTAPGYGSFRGLRAGDRVVAMARTGDSRGYSLIRIQECCRRSAMRRRVGRSRTSRPAITWW